MNFPQLQTEVGEWSRYNFPNNEPVFPLFGLIEETGELSHAVLKARQGIRGTPEEHRAAMVDAVGDVTIYMADFCGRNGIDLPRRPSPIYRIAGRVENAVLALSHAVGLLADDFAGGDPINHTKPLMVLDSLAAFCRVSGIDFDAAVETTWAEARKRDWVKFPKNGRTE